MPRPLRALVVDDKLPVATAVADLLSALGVETHAARSFEQARQHDPLELDLVICDLGLDDAAGTEVISWFAAGNPKLVPALMTGQASRELGDVRVRGVLRTPLLFKPIGLPSLRAFLSGAFGQ
jgi:DNA-binding response OmpR family regulator